ncbi:MAG: radical SAM protein [Alphaproteobacteria bacterium]|nr:radical SAM protein [Alphaproteobacteria bacterium]
MSSMPWNPRHRFRTEEVSWEEPPPPARLKVLVDRSRSILAHNDSDDLGFDWSVNAYRGCTHACAYCYARAWHEYLDLGAGSDFERIVLVKPEAAALLREAFEKRSWKGELVAFSGVTDCYQPLERKWELTRACLEVCADYRNPVGIVTRSPLVVRDLDVLRRLARFDAVRVSMSVPIVDDALARLVEPGAPPPSARLQAIRALSDAGIPVSVSLAPVIPGLNDHAVPQTLRAARDAGARWAWMTIVRFPGPVREVFERRLRAVLPDRADAVMARIDRAGVRGAGRVGDRMHGEGKAWEVTEQAFQVWRRRLGFEPMPPRGPTPFRRPGPEQLRLW